MILQACLPWQINGFLVVMFWRQWSRRWDASSSTMWSIQVGRAAQSVIEARLNHIQVGCVVECLMWVCLICESAMLLRPPATKTALQLEQNPEQTFSRCSSLQRLWRCSHWHSGCYYPSRCRKCRLVSVFRASESREVASKSIFPVSR